MTTPPSPAPRQPVVLLHSGGMSSRQWRRLADVLAPTHRVVMPDFLGSGDNPPWPHDQPFDFSQDVDLVARHLDELGEPAHLVGHSYGGLIALTLARRDPSRVRSLAAYDPVAFGVLYAANDREGLANLDEVGRQPIFVDQTQGGNEAWFAAFVDYWNGPGAWQAMKPAGREAFLRVGRKVFYEVSSLMRDRTPASAYAAIEAPALFLTGEHTPAAGRRVVALLSAALPQGRAETVAGAGHMGPLTHADAVNRALVDHIARASR